jgi:antitoxin component YwqK of YwqJK toxin-antitoxin module
MKRNGKINTGLSELYVAKLTKQPGPKVPLAAQMRKITSVLFPFFGFLALICWLASPASRAQTPADSSLLTSRKKPAIQKSGRKSGLSSVLPVDAPLAKSASNSGSDALATDDLPDLGLKVIAPKKKKKGPKPVSNYARNEYEGVPITHVVNKIGAGERVTTEEFFVLKDYQVPSPYAKDVYWYDERAGRVTTSVIKDKEYAQILHGPYRKFVGEALIEEGYYFVGTKHGRWESFYPDFTLKDKQHFAHGFPNDSRMTYYDEAKKKIKEILPVQYGKVTGLYRSFYEGGQLQEEGRFDDSVKVGLWREYHQFGSGGRTKKDTQYGKDKWDAAEPVVLREYDSKGKVIYDNKARKKEESEEEEF